jgi:hypothetical protein
MAEWQYWPAARVEPTDLRIESLDSTGRVVAERQERGLAALRNGKSAVAYCLGPHTACWRSYGELFAGPAGGEAARIRRFTRTYGPVSYIVAVDDAPFGRHARELAQDYRNIGAMWDASDNERPSLWRTAVSPDIEAAAMRSVHYLHAWLGGDRPPPIGSLPRFMMQQALRCFTDRAPMRRCDGCGYWMELTRRDRRHCTPRCRKAHARQYPELED